MASKGRKKAVVKQNQLDSELMLPQLKDRSTQGATELRRKQNSLFKTPQRRLDCQSILNSNENASPQQEYSISHTPLQANDISAIPGNLSARYNKPNISSQGEYYSAERSHEINVHALQHPSPRLIPELMNNFGSSTKQALAKDPANEYFVNSSMHVSPQLMEDRMLLGRSSKRLKPMAKPGESPGEQRLSSLFTTGSKQFVDWDNLIDSNQYTTDSTPASCQEAKKNVLQSVNTYLPVIATDKVSSEESDLPRKKLKFRSRRNSGKSSLNEEDEYVPQQSSDSRLDLNSTVVGELVSIAHPSVIRNQNLFVEEEKDLDALLDREYSSEEEKNAPHQSPLIVFLPEMTKLQKRPYSKHGRLEVQEQARNEARDLYLTPLRPKAKLRDVKNVQKSRSMADLNELPSRYEKTEFRTSREGEPSFMKQSGLPQIQDHLALGDPNITESMQMMSQTDMARKRKFLQKVASQSIIGAERQPTLPSPLIKKNRGSYRGGIGANKFMFKSSEQI